MLGCWTEQSPGFFQVLLEVWNWCYTILLAVLATLHEDASPWVLPDQLYSFTLCCSLPCIGKMSYGFRSSFFFLPYLMLIPLKVSFFQRSAQRIICGNHTLTLHNFIGTIGRKNIWKMVQFSLPLSCTIPAQTWLWFWFHCSIFNYLVLF